jgi:pimeloyl-ACP methyl ester carboxylesterase
MRFRIRDFVTLCLLVCLSYSVSAQKQRAVGRRAQTPLPAQERVIDVNGHKLWLKVAGTGAPAVVLDYGLGGNAGDWNNIFPEVATFTRVVAYDRAGYGKSESGPEPRSQSQIANDLHALLHGAGIEPPYVLVGHSLGGANIRAFANLFKDEVAGLVFVDPLSEDVFAAVSEKEREEGIAQQEAALKGAPAGALAEFEFLKREARTSFPELRSLGAPPDVPMMVLVAGTARPPHWVKSLLSQYGSWAAEATEGRLLLIPDSSHYIQVDEPAAIISAIRRVVFPSVRNRLEQTIKAKGVPAAIVLYRAMKTLYPAEYFSERILNTLGYQQLGTQHVLEAIELFKLNVEMYPQGFNTYDSLAEGYMVHGDRDLAIKNYLKSLALNSNNTGAINALKKLQAAP